MSTRYHLYAGERHRGGARPTCIGSFPTELDACLHLDTTTLLDHATTRMVEERGQQILTVAASFAAHELDAAALPLHLAALVPDSTYTDDAGTVTWLLHF